MDMRIATSWDELLQRHDAAVAQWPTLEGAGFKQALSAVTDGLEALARRAAAGCMGAADRSRLWRHLGDALSDLAARRDPDVLDRALAAYGLAEQALNGVEAPLEQAKLNFNCANTLRARSGGTDRVLLEEAGLRYRLANAGFRKHAPSLCGQAQSALKLLSIQLAVLGMQDQASGTHAALEAAQDWLAEDPDDPARQAQARDALLAASAARAPLAEGLARALGDGAGVLPEEPARGLVALLEQVKAQLDMPVNPQANDATDPIALGFKALLGRFREEIAAGRVEGQRATALADILRELANVMSAPEDSVASQGSRLARLRELMGEMAPLLVDPSTGGPSSAPTSRQRKLATQLDRLKQFMAAELTRGGQGASEREAGRKLFEQTATARAAIDPLGDDGLKTFERDHLRPLAARIDEFSRRRHLMVTRPFWGLPAAAAADPSGVFLTGAPGIQETLKTVLNERGLSLIRADRGTDVGLSRSRAIASARLLVCDWRLTDGAARAAACYDIGLAKAFGCAVLVVTDASAPALPFDIDTEPLNLAADDTHMARRLGAAIDDTLHAPPHAEARASVRATVDVLASACAGDPRPEVRQWVAQLREAGDDPIEVRRRAGLLLGFAGPDAPRLSLPAWPAAYPSGDRPRLFHVTAFGPAWADPVSEAVAMTCQAAGADYVRGDRVTDPRVVRSIWDEIGRASHVLVDLTGFNPNVALELGLAHGIGRRVLLVVQGRRGPGRLPRVDETQLFPAIRKLRTTAYDADAPQATLGPAIGTFVADHRDAPSWR